MSSRRYVGLNADLQQKTERFLAEFDANWKQQAFANSVRTLPFSDQQVRQVVLVELVKIDLEKRWMAGKGRRLESYLKACPELGTTTTVDPELILAEYEARYVAGVFPDLSKFVERFPNQAEDLRELVAELDVSDLDHVPSQAARSTKSQAFSTLMGEQGSMITRGLPERFGKYRIIRRLGEGGMGAIYLAEDTKLRRRVALKVPHATQFSSPELVERFSREARAAAALDHPNICSIYDVNEIDGIRYIEMAYVEGQDLSQLIASGKKLDPRQTAMILARLAVALEEAHRRNVIHRDLKPSNIRLKKNGEPVIMDFGLAKLSGQDDLSLTDAGQTMGTPIYMGPEQALGKSKTPTPAYDIYSLGAVMYEMLTGHPPFRGQNHYAVIKQVIESEPTPPREHRPELDTRLEAICLKAMSKQAADRFTSMAEFADALKQFLRDTRPVKAQTQKTQTSDQPTDAAVEARHLPRRVSARPSTYVVGAIGLVLLLATIFHAQLMLVVQGKGNLVIETDDPQVRVAFENQGVMIHDPATGESYQLSIGPNHVKTGAFQIDAQNVSSGLTFSTHQFTITRGGKKIVSVRLKPSSPQPAPQPVDLLALVDLERDALFDGRFRAEWRRDGNTLVSNANGNTCLQIPYAPPEEYELELEVQSAVGGALDIGIVVAGRQCIVDVDGWQDDEYLTRLYHFDGFDSKLSDGAYRGRVIPSGRPVSLKFTIGRTRVRFECEDRVIFDWVGDPERLRLDPFHYVAHPQVLFLQTFGTSFHVRRMQVIPIAGHGKRIMFASQSADPALVAMEWFKWRGNVMHGRTSTVDSLGKFVQSYSPRNIDLRGVFTPADIPHINALDAIEELDLANSKLTDGDLARLTEMPSLKTLDLSLTPITNQGLRHLTKFPQLRNLVLAGTAISDDALRHLARHTQLEHLDVRYTRVSNRGLQGLTSRLARLEVDYMVGASAPNSSDSVDLLQHVDLDKDVEAGDLGANAARFDGEALTLTRRHAGALIRHVPPDEYVLEMVVQIWGDPSLGMDFQAGHGSFHLRITPWMIFVETHEQQGPRIIRATSRDVQVLQSGQPSTIAVTVRRSRISVVRDNELLIEWNGDITNLSIGHGQKHIAVWDGDIQITKLQLTPILNERSETGSSPDKAGTTPKGE